MRIRSAAAIMLIAGASALPLAACSSPAPPNGYIWSLNYTPPESSNYGNLYSPSTCLALGYQVTYSLLWGHQCIEYEAATSQFELCAEQGGPAVKGNQCGWMYVDETTFKADGLLNSYYRTTAAGLPAASTGAP